MSDDTYTYDQELSPDEFLNSSDVVIEKVPTPEIRPGSFVFVRSITAAERGEIESGGARFKEKLQRGKDDPFARDFTVRFAWLCMCDKNGNRLFSDIQSVAKMKNKNSAMIARIAQRGQELSGFSQKDMEQLEKNSSEAQPADSLSD
jgi:hypothetical protein